MEPNNPYSSPVADVSTIQPTDTALLDRLASGQRLMIFSVLTSLLANLASNAVPALALVVFFAAAVLAIVGVVRLTSAMGYAMFVRILCAALMILPFFNLITMLILNARATKRLREGGYKVGFLGAKPKKA